jgi:hypothetical protein
LHPPRNERQFGIPSGERRVSSNQAGPSRLGQAAGLKWLAYIPVRTWLLTAAGVVVLQVAVLSAMGQPPICTCGHVSLWHGNVLSAENSQHLTDWYTFSHVIHGFGFYLLLWVIAPRMSIGLRFALALGLEAGWEIVENTPFIIDRYRQGALARGYVGDSVINSVGDTLAMALGFFLARVLPVWVTVALTLAMELFVGFMIRDNLTLNIIQLLSPSEAISKWQAGN